jgi:AraC family transcriptional regulator
VVFAFKGPDSYKQKLNEALAVLRRAYPSSGAVSGYMDQPLDESARRYGSNNFFSVQKTLLSDMNGSRADIYIIAANGSVSFTEPYEEFLDTVTGYYFPESSAIDDKKGSQNDAIVKVFDYESGAQTAQSSNTIRKAVDKMVRIYEIPTCKMVASQCGMFGDGKLERFDEWFSKFPRTMFPKDYLWYDMNNNGFVWYYIYEEGMTIPEDFSVVDFPGGLYAVSTYKDGEDNTAAINRIKSFIEESGCYREDTSRAYLGNVITPPLANEAMGYNQMDCYIPIQAVADSIA